MIRRCLLTLVLAPLLLPVLLLQGFPQSAQAEPPAPEAAAAQEVASYAINVRLDAEKRSLEGLETITYRNTAGQPMPDLVFHLYLNAFKDEKSIFMKESGTQHRGYAFNPQHNGWIEVREIRLGDGTGLKLELLEDGTLARAALPKAVAPGESVRLQVTFIAQLPQVFARTGWALDARGDPFFMVGQWFPKLGVWTNQGWNAYPFHANSEFFADFGSYDVNITVPRGYQTAGSGMPAGTLDNGDGTQTVRYRAQNVIDFAWTASPNLKEAFRRAGNSEIRYVYLPEHAWTVERVLDAAAKAVVDYGKWYGPYPYPLLTVVDAPDKGEGAGGMEYPTLVTAGTMDMIGLGNFPVQAGWERALEMVTAHEVGHQWWQSMVAFNEAEEPWLDEGFADYSTTRLMDVEYGAGRSALNLLDFEASYLDSRRISYITQPKVPMYGKAWDFTSMDYGNAAYSKPALALTTLERVLGEPTMLKIMSTFFQRYQYAHPTTADFRKVATEVSGQDLSWFFDGLVYGSGTINYVAKAIDAHSITAAREGSLVIPTEIEVTFADGRKQQLAWDGTGKTAGSEVEKQFTFDAEVRAFTIDPQRKLPIELVWSDNGLARQANLPAWLSVVTRLMYHLQDWLLVLGGI